MELWILPVLDAFVSARLHARLRHRKCQIHWQLVRTVWGTIHLIHTLTDPVKRRGLAMVFRGISEKLFQGAIGPSRICKMKIRHLLQNGCVPPTIYTGAEECVRIVCTRSANSGSMFRGMYNNPRKGLWNATRTVGCTLNDSLSILWNDSKRVWCNEGLHRTQTSDSFWVQASSTFLKIRTYILTNDVLVKTLFKF